MSIWGLPLSLVHAVAFHHHPSDSAETQFSSLTAVHVADVVVSATEGNGLNPDAVLDTGYLDRLGLREKEPLWRSLYSPPASPKTVNPGQPSAKVYKQIPATADGLVG